MPHITPFTTSLQALGATVFERGWLSSNNVLIQGDGPTALVDSGYSSHAALTLALVQEALHGRPLDLLLNTHLHSDHCGGNALLQAHYPALQTRIPPGHADAVTQWDADTLTYTPTGQTCPRFTHQGLLNAGRNHRNWVHTRWEVHGAKGHDPHSVVLFQRDAGVLISADALWNNGFGVVFPELEGIEAFRRSGRNAGHHRSPATANRDSWPRPGVSGRGGRPWPAHAAAWRSSWPSPKNTGATPQGAGEVQTAGMADHHQGRVARLGPSATPTCAASCPPNATPEGDQAWLDALLERPRAQRLAAHRGRSGDQPLIRRSSTSSGDLAREQQGRNWSLAACSSGVRY